MIKILFSHSTNYYWSNSTMYIYIAIIIFASALASCSVNPKVLKKGKSINSHFLRAAFLILWFFSAFRTIGKDYYDYSNVFLYSNTSELYKYGINMEIAYVYLNKIIRFFTDDFAIFIIVI